MVRSVLKTEDILVGDLSYSEIGLSHGHCHLILYTVSSQHFRCVNGRMD